MRVYQGFTLIELMVTVAVLAIVMAVAVPSFNRQIQNNRSLVVGEDFAHMINLARSEALKRGQAVALCASNADQTDCGTDWSNGWLIVLDDASNTAAAVTTSEVLRARTDLPDNAVVNLQMVDPPGTGAGTATTFLRYTSRGTLARINGAVKVARATAYATGCKGEAMRVITVGVAGTVASAKGECSNG